MPKKEIDFCFILSDLLATTPRAFRAVQTLLKNGYSVTVVVNTRIRHAVETENALVTALSKENFDYIRLEWRNNTPFVLFSKIFHKISRFLFFNLNFKGTLIEWFAMDYTILRQMNAARGVKAKVYVGHRPASLPIITFLAEKYKAKSWFDIEDEHFVESLDQVENKLTREIAIDNPTDFYTNASRLVGESFCRNMDFSTDRSIEILNSPNILLPKSIIPPQPSSPLSFVWFSQSVSKGRGLEEFFEALKIANIPAKVHLAGQVFPSFKSWLEKRHLPNVEVVYHGFVHEEEIIRIALQTDIGLALERDDVDKSRNLSITNKILTYAVCGNFILASRTAGQLDFMERLPDAGMVSTLKLQALADVLLSLHFEKDSIRENAQNRMETANFLRWEYQEKQLLGFVKTFV